MPVKVSCRMPRCFIAQNILRQHVIFFGATAAEHASCVRNGMRQRLTIDSRLKPSERTASASRCHRKCDACVAKQINLSLYCRRNIAYIHFATRGVNIRRRIQKIFSVSRMGHSKQNVKVNAMSSDFFEMSSTQSEGPCHHFYNNNTVLNLNRLLNADAAL